MPEPADPLEPADDPVELLRRWLQAARDHGVTLAEATAVATATADGAPDVRFLLLKEASDKGLYFYTNSHSAKAGQIAANNKLATVLYWRELGRQVRTRGPVEELERGEVEAYFATRPRDSQIGAWASRQSQPLTDMAELKERYGRMDARFAGGDVPLPSFWTGFLHQPLEMEFWLEGKSRLHERVLYTRDGVGGKWGRGRLFP